LLKQGTDFSHAITLQFAAAVVQHSVLLPHLLVDSVVPVACHMRSCLTRIGTEQVGSIRNQLSVCRKRMLSNPGLQRRKTRGTGPVLTPISKWHERPEFLYTYRLPSANNP